VEGKGAPYLLDELFVLFRDYLGDAYCVLKGMSPGQDVVRKYPYVQDVLPLVPEVVACAY
jgi:hypothetical protein